MLLPKDVPHTFRVEEPDPARLLQITYPAGLEEFFEEVSEPAPSPTLPPPSATDIEKLAEKLAALSANCNVEILGPPPGP